MKSAFQKFWYVLPALCAYILLSLLCILTFAGTQELWLMNVFSDWFLFMLFMPGFAVGTFLISKCMTTPRILRMKNRYKAICTQRRAQSLFLVCYLTLWLLLILAVDRIRFGPLTGLSLGALAGRYLRYGLMMFLFLNLSIILQRCPVRWLASSAHAALYVFFVAELMAIAPTLGKILPVPYFSLIFSWVDLEHPAAYAALIALNAAALWIQKYKTAYADLL